MATILRMIADLEAAQVAGVVKELQGNADKLGRTLGNLEARVEDKGAQATLLRLENRADKLRAKLDDELTVGGTRKAALELLTVEAAAERLDKKLKDAGDSGSGLAAKLSALGAGMAGPTLGGVGLGLAPALIPAAAAAAGAVGAIGVSFGAAAVSAGVFGLMAKSVLSGAGKAATQLATLQAKLAADTTAAQKKATEAQIAALKSGWGGAETQLIGSMTRIQHTWGTLSAKIAAPVLVPWLDAVSKAMRFLVPLVQPVADVFKAWGQTLNRDFSNPQTVSQIQKAVSAFGQFAALQLKDIGTFIGDIGAAFFNLGKDLAGSGANLGVAGTSLAKIGAAFLTWSKSAQARKDVQGFLHFIRTEGPLVGGILKDLAKYIPGILAGATAVGVLELKALSSFLNLVAKLPPGVAKPLTELAGAMLLLSKMGVLKVGVKFAAIAFGENAAAGAAGGAAGEAVAAGGAAGFLSKLTGAKWAMRGGIAVLGAEIVFRGVGAVAPTATTTQQQQQKAQTPAAAQSVLNFLFGSKWTSVTADLQKFIQDPVRRFFRDLGATIEDDWLTMWHALERDNTAAGHAITGTLDPIRHHIANVFDGARHDVASAFHDIANTFDQFRHFQGQTGAFEKDVAFIWDHLRNYTATTFDAIRHTIAGDWDSIRHGTTVAWDAIRHYLAGVLDAMRHSIASEFDSIRHGIAAAWDAIWHHSNAQASGGVTGIVNWFKKLPGRAIGALEGFGTDLYNFGKMIWTKFLHGMLSMQVNILDWIGHFVSSIWDKVKKFFGMSPPHPGSKFYDLGRDMMLHLEAGIKSHAHKAAAAAQGAAHQVGNVGSGVQRWAALVRKALAMEGLSQGLVGNVLYQMQTESSGNPNAINLTDINAQHGDPSRGLMQVIGSTFGQYHWPGTSGNIYDPLANIAAALNYARHVYGPTLMSGGMGIGSGHGYALGTASAMAGWAWVGERGPELVRFRGGEQVTPAAQRGGRLVHVENMYVREPEDVALVASKLSFKITASGFG